MDNIGTANELIRIIQDELDKRGIPYKTDYYSYPYSSLKQFIIRDCRITKINYTVYYALIGVRTTIGWWLENKYQEGENDNLWS